MTKKIKIEGMSCHNCVRHVREALEEIKGVVSVDIDLSGKYALVETNTQISDDIFKAAIDEAGYDVVGIE